MYVHTHAQAHIHTDARTYTHAHTYTHKTHMCNPKMRETVEFPKEADVILMKCLLGCQVRLAR